MNKLRTDQLFGGGNARAKIEVLVKREIGGYLTKLEQRALRIEIIRNPRLVKVRDFCFFNLNKTTSGCQKGNKHYICECNPTPDL